MSAASLRGRDGKRGREDEADRQEESREVDLKADLADYYVDWFFIKCPRADIIAKVSI